MNILKTVVKIIKHFEYFFRNKELVSYFVTAYLHVTYIYL